MFFLVLGGGGEKELKLTWQVKEQGVADEFWKTHLLVRKDRSSFPVVVMSQTEKWQSSEPPKPINSPHGSRLVYTSPKRGIFNQ